MPLEDFTKWIKPEVIAEFLKMWADGLNKPKSGSYALLKYKDGIVVPDYIQ